MGAHALLLFERASEHEYLGTPIPDQSLSDPPAAEPYVLAVDGFLLGRLRFHSGALPLDVGAFETWERWARENRPRHLDEIQMLERFGARLAIPLRTQRELLAVLLLSASSGRETYELAEREVLQYCAGHLTLMIENARLTHRVVEQERLRRDLALAAEVQKRLLPEESPQVVAAELAAVSLPARSVGGDYYDFLELADHRLGIAIADVAGKGIAAALIMSVVQASLRILTAHCELSLPQLVSKMNQFLHRSTQSNSYATFFYAQFDDETRQLQYVNAGHPPPYLLRVMQRSEVAADVSESDHHDIQELSTGGTVLGLFPGSAYGQATVELTSGDILLAFTDGVTEALNPSNEEFGEVRLKAALRAAAPLSVNEIASRISGELKNWIRDRAQHDDLTFIVMKVR